LRLNKLTTRGTLIVGFLDATISLFKLKSLFVNVVFSKSGRKMRQHMFSYNRVVLCCAQARIYLGGGDRLSLLAGHVTSRKYSREAYNHRITALPGGFLEDVTFCIISHL
jgi:hypothetical protein